MTARRRHPDPVALAAFSFLILTGCSGEVAGGTPDSWPPLVEISSVFETPRDTIDNIDSPAVWHGASGEHWLLATAKETDMIVISDAATGELIRRFGGEGTGAGEMNRPNGIAVIDDLLFLVERDNARVQIFTLPEMTSLGSYGGKELRVPYGISVHRDADGSYSSYVTDNYEESDDVIPADSLLGERVRQYRVRIDGDSLRTELIRTFGEREGPGVLRVVESLLADPAGNRLVIADEQEGASKLKVYTLDGTFTGDIVDDGLFASQAEGIVLYRCGPTEGYWIATDQSYEINNFHVFDRETFAHLGTFQGRGVLNTDGIALTQIGFGRFPAGAFYAVHNDGNVAAFSWSEIAGSLNLRSDCEG